MGNSKKTSELDTLQKRYLEVLSERYPTIASAATEIINLQAILNLPKGTEHFLTDIHGEYEAFSHVLRNGSGAVRKKIDDVFGHTLTTADKRALATLIYYPEEKIEYVRKTEEDMDNWYKIMLYRLIEVCKKVSSKYTRSKVRKALPKDYRLRDRRTDQRRNPKRLRIKKRTTTPSSIPSFPIGRAGAFHHCAVRS